MRRGFPPVDAAFGLAGLYAAFRRALRGHRGDPEAAVFLLELQPRLCALARSLAAGAWQPGPLRAFSIRDPKPRQVVVAHFADRVVHHALVAALEAGIEHRLDAHSYACRRGKGLHRCVRVAQRYARRYAYALTLDISKYFATLPHPVVLDVLRRYDTPEPYLALAALILARGAHGSADPHRGMPIGLLTSQFFGNVALDPVDRLLRAGRPVIAHVKYMDDVLVFAADKGQLWRTAERVGALVGGMGLRLKPERTQVRPVSEGVGFCGLRVFGGQVRPDHAAVRRWTRRLRALRRAELAGLASAAFVVASAQATFAPGPHAPPKGLRRDLIHRLWPGPARAT